MLACLGTSLVVFLLGKVSLPVFSFNIWQSVKLEILVLVAQRGQRSLPGEATGVHTSCVFPGFLQQSAPSCLLLQTLISCKIFWGKKKYSLNELWCCIARSKSVNLVLIIIRVAGV